tara:strand:- start:740 stop:1345 length:606 start_codon:yes stop_codon:yes gene_type:complete
MVGKSLFNNSIHSGLQRSLLIPISLGQSTVTASSGNIDLISNTYYDILKIIESIYGANMASKNYEAIPNNYDHYAQLQEGLHELQAQTTDPDITLLLQIAEHTLTGAINSYAIYGENILLRVDKTTLENNVSELLNEVNVETVNDGETTSSLSLTRSFRLAAVYNYYIMIYGMPASGAGFDPVKIAFLVDILTEKGINPYA